MSEVLHFPVTAPEDGTILAMSFEELNAERELLMREARGLAELPPTTLRRLAHIMSRLRTLSSTSKPPKAKKRRTTLDDL